MTSNSQITSTIAVCKQQPKCFKKCRSHAHNFYGAVLSNLVHTTRSGKVDIITPKSIVYDTAVTYLLANHGRAMDRGRKWGDEKDSEKMVLHIKYKRVICSPFIETCLAGTPATTAPEGTSLTTTAPAPTTALLPMVTFPNT